MKSDPFSPGTHTVAGRVVYNRKPHIFTAKDGKRVIKDILRLFEYNVDGVKYLEEIYQDYADYMFRFDTSVGRREWYKAISAMVFSNLAWLVDERVEFNREFARIKLIQDLESFIIKLNSMG
jgi:hypothetical protein